jgi:hypothetical protein
MTTNRSKERDMKKSCTLALVICCGGLANAAETNTFVQISGHYEAIRQVLMKDSTTGVADRAEAIAALSANLARNFDPVTAGVDADDAESVKALLPAIEAGARRVADAGDLESVRSALAELTKPLVRYHAVVRGDRPVVTYCPMEKKAWLQPDEPVGNPYAPSMLRCGEIVSR